MRRLTDKTIKKYKELEKEGKLTKRQRSLWDSHKAMVEFGKRVGSFMGIFVSIR